MAEKNYPSSSQESLPLSEESCMFLLNTLGSPLNDFVNRVSGLSGANATVIPEYPDAGETAVSVPVNEECPVMLKEEVSNMYLTPQIQSAAQYLLENVVPDHKIAPSSLPAIENWPGEYNFKVTFRVQENVKGAQCVYSKLKNKLYVGKDVPCPINFSTNTVMTDDVCIRAMALFSSADHASELVHRCVNHSMADLQKNLPEAEHLVRCESRSAVYVNDAAGRHSVIIPFENPPAGQQFSSYMFKFTCFGSCAGGPNRRPLMLVFSLERGGAVIGRQRVDLKICACPSRDMKLDEKQLNLEDKKPLKRKSAPPPPGTYVDTVPNFHSAVKKMRPVPDKGPYNITVQDNDCYEFLKLMKKCFYLYLRNGGERNPSNSAFINFIRSTFSSSEDEGN